VNENIYLAAIFVVVGAIFLYCGVTGNTPASGPTSLNDQQPPAPNQRQHRMNTGLGIAFIIFGVIYAASFLLRAH
jgi:hypothetical protein